MCSSLALLSVQSTNQPPLITSPCTLFFVHLNHLFSTTIATITTSWQQTKSVLLAIRLCTSPKGNAITAESPTHTLHKYYIHSFHHKPTACKLSHIISINFTIYFHIVIFSYCSSLIMLLIMHLYAPTCTSIYHFTLTLTFTPLI